MKDNKIGSSRLELVQSGKLEERHSVRRPSIIPKQEEEVETQDKDVARLRPELVAMAIMIIVLIVLAIVGF